jgi:hypothetical protein
VGRRSGRRDLARAAALSLVLLIGVIAAPTASAGWGRPFRFAQPFSLDVTAPRLAFSTSGTAAVAFGVVDVDNPSDSAAHAVWRSPGGTLFAMRRVPKAQEVLDLAFASNGLVMLTGDSPSEEACCSSAGVARMPTAHSFARSFTLLRGLAGATEGQLLSFSGRLLAAVATERGVWVAQTYSGERFGPVHQLAAGAVRPQALQAAAVSGGGTVVVWSASDRSSKVPRRVYITDGTAHAAPGAAHALLSVRNGHRIDELALADGAAGPSVAWVESWYDRSGAYHSQVSEADISHPRQWKTFAISSTIASGLSFASDSAGDQLLAWRTCTWSVKCTVRVAVRRAGRRFSGPVRLGSVDAAEMPVAALGPHREGLIGWIDNGHVLASQLSANAGRPSSAQTVSSTNYAADLNIAFSPSDYAVATWSQGTLAPDVMGATYRHG